MKRKGSMRSITLDNITITDNSLPYTIAEIGANHMGSVDEAKYLIDEAARLGINAVKFQKRSNKTLLTKKLYDSGYENENSYGKTYGEHREFLELSLFDYKELTAHASSRKITLFATPFDIQSLYELESLGMPFYKIQSGDVPNLYLINAVCETKKPIILSTGAATCWEIERATDLMKYKKVDFALLHCTSLYPTRAEDVAIRVIKKLRKNYPDRIIGYSSHYDGILAAVAAYCEGARIIEHHFTRSHTQKGTDHALSLIPAGLGKLIGYLKKLREMRLKEEKDQEQIKREKESIRKLSKSLYFLKDARTGEIIDFSIVTPKIPFADDAVPIGTIFKNDKDIRINRNMKKGEALTLDSI